MDKSEMLMLLILLFVTYVFCTLLGVPTFVIGGIMLVIAMLFVIAFFD